MRPGLRWTRRLWMRLAALNAFSAVVVALIAFRVSDPDAAMLLRVASGFQFMHSLATFACATFMNIGAHRARLAPAFFLTGSAIFSGALYGRALSLWTLGDAPLVIGAALMAAGWGVLAMAAGDIDRDA